MVRKSGVGKAHSKIIWMGEHSVVYGYPAIAIPLASIEVICQVNSGERPLTFDFSDTLSMAVYAALSHLGRQGECLSYTVRSAVPQKRGMGSSAAVSIAAIRAVFDYFNEPIDRELLEILVNQAEITAHANPSGLDAKTCLSDKAIKYIRNVGFETLVVDLPAYLLIADTGIQGQTREAVAKVAENKKRNRPYFNRLGALAEQVELAISQKAIDTIGHCMCEAHACLREIGVSIPQVDELVALAMAEGALGAKMSGGGLGGCVIALIDNLETAQHISHTLKEKGAIQTWIEKLSL